MRDALLPGDMLAVAGLVVLVCLVALPNLRNPDVDGLDSAHHLMDGYFFRDLLSDHPHAHLQQYVFSYYKQYPALGFLFWPPLFPFVLGIFCTVFGTHVLTARICMLCFGVVFVTSFYLILRRSASAWVSFTAAAALSTVPGMAWSFNQVMLEMPTLAMMCLAVLAYLHFMRRLGEGRSFGGAVACAVACAAVVYTKQPGWFVYPALCLDLVLQHPRHLRRAEVWVSVGALAVLCLPLALFTLKFGHADLAQSVGSNTKLIMREYSSLPRWSLAAWTYYPKLAATLLNPVLVMLTAGAFALAAFSRDFLRRHALWFGWWFFAYVTFSFYDNRAPRHATFWWPAWVALAAGCMVVLMESVPQRWRRALPLLLLLPLPMELHRLWKGTYTEFHQSQAAVRGLFAQGDPGNILAFGEDKQVLVALVREQDPRRSVHIIRGERLLNGRLTLPEVCRRYRIRTVVVELSANADRSSLPTPGDLASLRASPSVSFVQKNKPVQLLLFRYDGPIDSKMADVSLSNDLL